MAAHATIITLGVADLGASSSFYEALGFHRSSASQDTISFFRAGSLVLAIFGRDALAHDAGVSAHGTGFRGVTIAMNLSSDYEVDREYARWLAAGASAVKAPVKVFWGGYSSYVADPDGHLWELAHNPHLPLRADGSAELPD